MYILRALTSWNYDSWNLLAVAAFVALVALLGRSRQRWATFGTVAAALAFAVWFLQFDWA